MTPGQRNLPSDSIKVVPGRSKVRVESSNPVARGNHHKRKPAKVMHITPEEAIHHLSSGGIQTPVSPISGAIRPKRGRGRPRKLPIPVFPAPRTLESQRPVPACPPSEAPRTVPACPGFEAPRSVLPPPPFASPRPVLPPPPFESPRPVLPPPPFEAPRPGLAHPPSEAPRLVPFPVTSEVSRPKPARPTSEASRPVTAHTAAGSRREIVLGLQALSLSTQTERTVRQRTNPSRLQSRMVEPSSPRALQICARVKQQAANATQAVEGTVLEVGAGSNDHGYKEIRQSTSEEEVWELLLHRPALHPTWKGRIVDSATQPEFDCDFWAKPASNIRKKADKLSKAMPILLKAELFPTGLILDDVFGRTPRLSNVEIYFFSDEKKTERVKGEHAHVFEVMATQDAMITVDINGTELFICSSKQLDKTSQFLINTLMKTENFLWGFILPIRNPQAPVPETSDKDLDDMDLDIEYPTPSVAIKLIAESQSTPSESPAKMSSVSVPPGFEKKSGVSVPPGFEKMWTPALVKLSIEGTSKPLSDLTGCAGIVRDQSGQWVLGYFRCHKSMSKVVAELLAIYHGLKILWDSGIRRIRLETTSLEVINALTTNSGLFPKRRSFLDRCKDIILRNWECEIYHISKEQNRCAEWLASRVEDQPQELVFYEYPPRALVGLLEEERLLAAST